MEPMGDPLGWDQRFRKAGFLLLWVGAVLAAQGNPEPPVPVSEAENGSSISRPEEDVWLFAVRLDQTILSSAFPAFPRKAGFLLPLGELCRVLDLAIQVNPAQGLADGFFIDEKRRFRVDITAGTVDIQGVRNTFDRALVEARPDDIYVDAQLLSKWLPLDLEVVRSTAFILVKPRELLPLQLRWTRKRESGQAQAEPGFQTFPKVRDTYRAFDFPFVDESLRVTSPSHDEADDKRRYHVQSTTFATGDLLGLSSNLYAVLDSQGGLSEFRMTVGRRDPSAGLLGALRATEFAVGEVLNPGIDLVTQPFSGTGALLTNFPLVQANAFDRHSFQGNLPPGWQVELYRNQGLLAFQASRPDGRYEFLNVTLFYGWNDFRLVFYGPQGQRREEVARFDVSESQTPQGAFHYRLMGDDSRIAGTRSQFEARYGLSKQLAANLALARVQFNGSIHTYTQAGLQAFWKPLSTSFTVAKDVKGGTSEEVGLRTRIGPLSLTARHAELQGGFSSEVFNPIYGPLGSRSRLEATMLLSSRKRSWLTMDFGASQERLSAGGMVEHLYDRLSTSWYGYFISNEVIRSRVSGSALAFPATTTGNLLASKIYPTFSLRGQADYQLSGGTKLNGLTVLAETPRFPPLIVRASLTRTIIAGETHFLVGVNKNEGAYSLGLDVTYSSRNRLVVDLTIRLGLAREPRHRRIYAQAQGIASQGAVSARAFLDANANGRRDPEENDIKGVNFLVNGANQPGSTDAAGVAFLTGLSADQDANISVDTNSLEDPLMRPGQPGFRITPRAGHVAVVDVPLALFGEINGLAFANRPDGHQELAGLHLELLGADGKLFRKARTAYDGFYTLEGIPPGTYQLRVSGAEAKLHGLLPPLPREVRIAADGTIIDGLDLILDVAPTLKEKP
jgi:hypothetical protein